MQSSLGVGTDFIVSFQTSCRVDLAKLARAEQKLRNQSQPSESNSSKAREEASFIIQEDDDEDSFEQIGSSDYDDDSGYNSARFGQPKAFRNLNPNMHTIREQSVESAASFLQVCDDKKK